MSATGAALFTASGNATGCAAGLAVLDEIERLDLVQRSAELGGYLHECLVDALGDVEIVGDIRGLGMIQGVELVKDRASREPEPACRRQSRLPRLGARPDRLLRGQLGERARDHTAVDPDQTGDRGGRRYPAPGDAGCARR